MPTPGATRSGKCDFSSPSFAAFGPTMRPESFARSVVEADEVAHREVELLEVGLEHRRSRRPLRCLPNTASHCGPSSAISTRPAGLTASTMRRPSCLLQRRQHRLVDRDVRDAEVAREQLHMRERVAGARRQDARERRQVGDRLRQHVDAVGAEVLDALHVGLRVQHAAREPGVQRVEAGADLACPSSLCCTPASRFASRDSASSTCE